MTFHIFCPNPDPTPNVRQNHLVLYPVVLAECLSLYVFGRGVVVVFFAPLSIVAVVLSSSFG